MVTCERSNQAAEVRKTPYVIDDLTLHKCPFPTPSAHRRDRELLYPINVLPTRFTEDKPAQERARQASTISQFASIRSRRLAGVSRWPVFGSDGALALTPAKTSRYYHSRLLHTSSLIAIQGILPLKSEADTIGVDPS